MARRKQLRTIASPPLMAGYKPFGIPRTQLESVTLNIDEYESLRLLDYEGLNQEQAAERMNISRPTLTRIYDSARKAIAKAFVEGKMLLIEGGNINFDKEWYRCGRCHKLVDGSSGHQAKKCCEGDKDGALKPIITE